MSTYSNQIVLTKLAEYERHLHASGFSKSKTATSEKDLQPLEYFVTFGTSDPNKFGGEEMANVICRKE
jgi:hypothetical protein